MSSFYSTKKYLLLLFACVLLNIYISTVRAHMDQLCTDMVHFGKTITNHSSTSLKARINLISSPLIASSAITGCYMRYTHDATHWLSTIIISATIPVIGVPTYIYLAKKYTGWQINKALQQLELSIKNSTSTIQLSAALELLQVYENTFVINSIIYPDSQLITYHYMFQKIRNLLEAKIQQLV